MLGFFFVFLKMLLLLGPFFYLLYTRISEVSYLGNILFLLSSSSLHTGRTVSRRVQISEGLIKTVTKARQAAYELGFALACLAVYI